MIQLLLELSDIAFNRRPFEAEAELADLLPQHATNLRVERLKPDHGFDYRIRDSLT